MPLLYHSCGLNHIYCCPFFLEIPCIKLVTGTVHRDTSTLLPCEETLGCNESHIRHWLALIHVCLPGTCTAQPTVTSTKQCFAVSKTKWGLLDMNLLISRSVARLNVLIKYRQINLFCHLRDYVQRAASKSRFFCSCQKCRSKWSCLFNTTVIHGDWISNYTPKPLIHFQNIRSSIYKSLGLCCKNLSRICQESHKNWQ